MRTSSPREEPPFRDPGGFERLAAAIEADAATLDLAGTKTTPALGAAVESLHLDEVLSSVGLAGVRLDRAEGTALLARGVAVGGRLLRDYEAVADYSQAARLVASHGPIARHRARPFVRLDEILELHHRAMLRTGRAPGTWRDRNVHAVASGMVPPPHWLVTREMSAFVDRYAGGPSPCTSPLTWAAAAHARFLRVQPFDDGNGRVGRLVANLLLRRAGLTVAALTGGLSRRYPHALARADSGDTAPLARLFADAVRQALARLLVAASAGGALLPLRALVEPERVPALVKAAQRGRLRAVRSGTRLLSTPAWIAEYETSHAGGRRTTGAPGPDRKPNAP